MNSENAIIYSTIRAFISMQKKPKTFMLITTTAPLVATLRMQYIFLHYALQTDTFWNAMTHKMSLRISKHLLSGICVE